MVQRVLEASTKVGHFERPSPARGDFEPEPPTGLSMLIRESQYPFLYNILSVLFPTHPTPRKI